MGNDAPDDFGKNALQDRVATNLFLADEFGTGECDDFGTLRVFVLGFARVLALDLRGFHLWDLAGFWFLPWYQPSSLTGGKHDV